MKTLLPFLLLFSLHAFASKIDVDVEGMSCGMCVNSITQELKSTEKVEGIVVSLENKRARFEEIKGKKIGDPEIKAAIKKAGYDVTKISRH